MYLTTTGIVLRQVPYKESSRMLTVLTAASGKLSVSAKGASRRGSKIAAATQFLAFSEMTLSGTNGRWTLSEARSLELFDGLREDLSLLALGTYFAQEAEAAADEDVPDPELLSMLLNGLYALSEKKRSPELVKAAFELRLMVLEGFAPALDACAVCHRPDPVAPRLSLRGGVLHCRDCDPGIPGREAVLDPSSLEAMRHVCSADVRRIYSFTLPEDSLARLAGAAEGYLCAQTEHRPPALDYYLSVAGANALPIPDKKTETEE